MQMLPIVLFGFMLLLIVICVAYLLRLTRVSGCVLSAGVGTVLVLYCLFFILQLSTLASQAPYLNVVGLDSHNTGLLLGKPNKVISMGEPTPRIYPNRPQGERSGDIWVYYLGSRFSDRAVYVFFNSSTARVQTVLFGWR